MTDPEHDIASSINFGESTQDIPPEREKARKGRKTVVDKTISGLEDLYGLLAIGVGLANKQDAKTIARSAHDLAESWRDVIDNDENIRKIMHRLANTQGWAKVAAVHVPVGMILLENHQGSFEHLVKPKRKERKDMDESPNIDPDTPPVNSLGI